VRASISIQLKRIPNISITLLYDEQAEQLASLLIQTKPSVLSLSGGSTHDLLRRRTRDGLRLLAQAVASCVPQLELDCWENPETVVTIFMDELVGSSTPKMQSLVLRCVNGYDMTFLGKCLSHSCCPFRELTLLFDPESQMKRLYDCFDDMLRLGLEKNLSIIKLQVVGGDALVLEAIARGLETHTSIESLSPMDMTVTETAFNITAIKRHMSQLLTRNTSLRELQWKLLNKRCLIDRFWRSSDDGETSMASTTMIGSICAALLGNCTLTTLDITTSDSPLSFADAQFLRRLMENPTTAIRTLILRNAF
jgi:hypothetical protein